MNILQLILGLLPEAGQIASIFIHNPNSQHTLSVVVSTAEALTPALTAIAQNASSAASAAAAPSPVEPVIPAGVPSAH